MNLFLVYGDIESQKPPQRLYALLDQADTLGDGRVSLLFDAVDASWFDGMGGQFDEGIPPDVPVEYFEAAPVYVLQWDLNPSALPPTLLPLGQSPKHPEDDREWLLPFEQNWIELELVPGAGAAPEAELYYNLFAEPIPVTMTMAGPVSSRAAMRLKNSDPLAPIGDSTTTDITNAISGAFGGNAIDHLGVYDVGQGNCVGFLVGGRVALYSDFGGGVLANKKTFPAALTNFCFCSAKQPPVMLSHWDWDHWSSANRDTRAKTSTWIVPRQKPLGHVHGTFIAAVTSAGGNFLIWPSGGAACTAGQITIDKCTGTHRNDSGLAVKVTAPKGTSGDPILLPGDAIYSYLPASIAQPFDDIVCAHHGGKIHGAVAPACPANNHSRLVYSYGKGNRYKHPLSATRTEHDNKGWRDPTCGSYAAPFVRLTADRSTAKNLGHVAIGWTTWNTPPSVACRGTCDLEPQQT